MARILTGIQSSGKPHLGKILGAIKPAIELSQSSENESFFFIADMHSLTTIKNAEERIENVYAVAAAWLAFGFDTDKNVFYKQSSVPEVTELTWYLNCFTPFPMLGNAHSFKDKSDRLSDVNAGLFDYPVLMAADILLYDANIVPVGKDQRQHLEMTRDIAGSLNHQMKADILVLPEAEIRKDVMTVPGIDGQKMSKSYGNTIDIFLPEKQLKKRVMAIETDSKGLDEPNRWGTYMSNTIQVTMPQRGLIRCFYFDGPVSPDPDHLDLHSPTSTLESLFKRLSYCADAYIALDSSINVLGLYDYFDLFRFSIHAPLRPPFSILSPHLQ